MCNHCLQSASEDLALLLYQSYELRAKPYADDRIVYASGSHGSTNRNVWDKLSNSRRGSYSIPDDTGGLLPTACGLSAVQWVQRLYVSRVRSRSGR